MATAGTVTIRLDGDSATLVRELNKANQASQRTFREIKDGATALAQKFALVSAAATAAFAALARESFVAVDALAKTADRLGITTEALRTLQVAADLSGVAQEQLGKSLLKQQQAIVGAVNGGAELARTFSQLGLDAKELINLPADQQFGRIAAALGEVDNVARRNTLALDIWGARAAEMINLAQAGTGGLGELRQVLGDLNVTVSRFDAGKIEQANDAMGMARLAAEGVGNSIAVALAPRLTEMANSFTEAARSAHGFRDEIADAFDSVIAGGTRAMGILEGVGQAVAMVARKAADTEDPIDRGIMGAIKGAWDRLAAGADLAFTGRVNIFDPDQGKAWGDAMLAALPPVKAEIEAIGVTAQTTATAVADSARAAASTVADATAQLQQQMEAALATSARRIQLQAPTLEKPEAPQLDPGVIADFTQASTRQYLEAWTLANEQRVAMEQAVRESLFQSDLVAGEALIELAASQAREKVRRELEARGAAFDEAGVPIKAEDRAAFEQAVGEETLAIEADTLNRRLALQTEFQARYSAIQLNLTKFFTKSWAASHQATLANMATFGAAAAGIAGALFANNKKFAIAQALISTYTGVAKALELTPPASFAMAAQVLATGLAQVRSITSTQPGGGAATGGIAGGGVGLSPPVASAPAKPGQSDQPQTAVQVILQGDVYGWDEYIEAKVVRGLRDAVDGRDVVLIGPGSRQAAEIRGG